MTEKKHYENKETCLIYNDFINIKRIIPKAITQRLHFFVRAFWGPPNLYKQHTIRVIRDDIVDGGYWKSDKKEGSKKL